ncbi:MAG: DUF2332 domain-containing protein [Pirellulales bacterium]
MTGNDHVKTQYKRFAENECKGYSDLYFRLANDVARDNELVEFISQRPVTQPNLFFASIQFLTGPERMPVSAAELSVVVRDRNAEIAALMQSRRTQTNEVGRCAAILPALPSSRLALLEVGASAGLCLLLDEFFYDYGSQHVGDPSSPVKLRCAANSPVPRLVAMPEVVWRGGLDLSPVDLYSDDDVRWLLSCVWADHAERRQRLAAAIEMAQARGVSVRRGDLVSDLPALLAEVPHDAKLVVFHSAVLAYVSVEQRVAFANTLAAASRHRKIVWISNESPTVVPEITALALPLAPRRFLLGRTTFTRGQRRDEMLAIAHPHGASLEWLSSAGLLDHSPD